MTNYIRNYGLSKTGLVILLDLGKALLASYLGALLLEPYGYWMEGAMLAGVFVSLGHDYPVTLGFRGEGNPLRPRGGICGGLADCAVDFGCVWYYGALLSRYVSLGSCLAAVALGVSFWVLHGERPWVVAGWW